MNLLRNAFIILTLAANTLPAQELIHSLQLGGAAGSSVAGVGDIDGDGRDDFAVADSHNGGVSVFSGHDASVLLTLPVAAIGHSFGNLPSYVIDAGGDGNGDGIPDVLVTRIGDSLAGPGGYVPIGPGSATLWSGADGSVLWTAGPTGPDLGNSFGFAAANIGDTDGDGRDDFAVGAPVEAIAGQSDVGWVEVLSGATGQSLLLIPGVSFGNRFGQSLDGVGDRDGDGHGDFIVGTLAGGGMAEVRSGSTGAVLTTYTVGSPVTGPAIGLAFPWVTVAGEADVDGDGVLDVAVGKRADITGGPIAGIFAMISGATGLPIRTIVGSPCDGFGAVLALADFNNDGFADVAAGRRNDLQHNDDVRVTSGLAAGAAPGPAFTSIGLVPDAAQLAVAGDVNGDGYVDLLVGADEYGPNAGSVGVLAGGPWLGEAADGDLGVLAGQPTDILQVAGSTGGDVRRVERSIGELTTFAVQQPPTMSAPAHFAVFGALYLPLETDEHVLPSGIGSMCIPAATLSSSPLLFTLASSFPTQSVPRGQVFEGSMTPFAIAFRIPIAAKFVIQGVVEETPLDFKTTNGILIDVR